MARRDWRRIGEVADETGLTVRTLRWYDEIGLLVPSLRTEGGERRYIADDLERLERILLLRALGMGLDNIGVALESGQANVRHLVAAHRARLAEEQQQIAEVVVRLDRIEAALEIESPEGTIDHLIDAIREAAMIEKYYSEEERRTLAERATDLGSEGLKRAEQDWSNLIAAVTEARDRGIDPVGEEALELARRWNDLIEAFTGGDPAIAASLATMYKSEGPRAASHGMIDPAVMEWIGKGLGVVRGS